MQSMKKLNTVISKNPSKTNINSSPSLESEIQNLQEENVLLLETLHNTQEMLEAYYQANLELVSAIGRSEETMLRARRVISRFIKNP
jgi:hypothetical protein